MNTLLLSLAGALVAALSLVFWLVRRAPEGHEDERGFHFGSPEHPQPVPAQAAETGASRGSALGARTAV